MPEYAGDYFGATTSAAAAPPVFGDNDLVLDFHVAVVPRWRWYK